MKSGCTSVRPTRAAGLVPVAPGRRARAAGPVRASAPGQSGCAVRCRLGPPDFRIRRACQQDCSCAGTARTRADAPPPAVRRARRRAGPTGCRRVAGEEPVVEFAFFGFAGFHVPERARNRTGALLFGQVHSQPPAVLAGQAVPEVLLVAWSGRFRVVPDTPSSQWWCVLRCAAAAAQRGAQVPRQPARRRYPGNVVEGFHDRFQRMPGAPGGGLCAPVRGQQLFTFRRIVSVPTATASRAIWGTNVVRGGSSHAVYTGNAGRANAHLFSSVRTCLPSQNHRRTPVPWSGHGGGGVSGRTMDPFAAVSVWNPWVSPLGGSTATASQRPSVLARVPCLVAVASPVGQVQTHLCS